jgi:hypothetical protein
MRLLSRLINNASQHDLSESRARTSGLIHVDDQYIAPDIVGSLRIPQRLGSRQGAL